MVLFAVYLAGAGCDPQSDARRQNQANPKSVIAEKYSPKPEDEKLSRGTVEIAHVRAHQRSSNIGYTIDIQGNLPTPCHQLRLQIPERASAGGILDIKAWSVFDPAQICVQMLQPFSATVELPYSEKFTVLVNGHSTAR
jgi:hypothetical protein